MRRRPRPEKIFKKGDEHPFVFDWVFMQYQNGLPRWGTRDELSASYARAKKWREDHPDITRQHEARYRKSHPRTKEQLARHSAQMSKYVKDKCRNDNEFRIRHACRCQIGNMMRKYRSGKCAKTSELVGLPWPDFVKHVESLFHDGMSWENMGKHGWHLDHKTPCKWFDVTIPDQQRECFHYTNLQPMWESENCSKGARYASP